MDTNKPQGNNVSLPTEFGKILRIERINKGMKSAEKMAEALGITASMLSEIENGKKAGYPDLDILIRCRDFFGWKIQESDSKDSKREKIQKTLKLFETGFLSSDIISLNVKYFHVNKKKILIEFMLAILFLPEQIPEGTQIDGNGSKRIYVSLEEKTRSCLSRLLELVENTGIEHPVVCDLHSPPARRKITRNRKKNY